MKQGQSQMQPSSNAGPISHSYLAQKVFNVCCSHCRIFGSSRKHFPTFNWIGICSTSVKSHTPTPPLCSPWNTLLPYPERLHRRWAEDSLLASKVLSPGSPWPVSPWCRLALVVTAYHRHRNHFMAPCTLIPLMLKGSGLGP